MTTKLYYRDGYLKKCRAKIMKIRNVGENIEVLLDSTILYPGGGGQPSDKGKIKGKEFEIDVFDSKEEDGDIWHIGKLIGKKPKEGEDVDVEIDWKYRYDNMVQHTAQHIISAAILKLMGANTTGFQIFENKSKIEIEVPSLSWNDIYRIEEEVNSVAKKCMEVTVGKFSGENLRKTIKKNVDELRIVKVGDYDATACGGVHVKNSIEILPVKIVNFYRKTSRTWRLEFVAGNRCIRIMNNFLEDFWNAMKETGRKEPPLSDRVKEMKYKYEKMVEEEKVWRKRYEKLIRMYLNKIAMEVGNYTVAFFEDLNIKEADKLIDEKIDVDFIVIIYEKNFSIYSRVKKAKEVLNCLKKTMDIRGGGGDFSVKGRVENAERLREEVINCIKKL